MPTLQQPNQREDLLALSGLESGGRVHGSCRTWHRSVTSPDPARKQTMPDKDLFRAEWCYTSSTAENVTRLLRISRSYPPGHRILLSADASRARTGNSMYFAEPLETPATRTSRSLLFLSGRRQSCSSLRLRRVLREQPLRIPPATTLLLFSAFHRGRLWTHGFLGIETGTFRVGCGSDSIAPCRATRRPSDGTH
jgi:hypothetical protein